LLFIQAMVVTVNSIDIEQLNETAIGRYW
jgi:hypothetical protein